MGGKNPVIALVERTHNVMEKEWVTSDEMDVTDKRMYLSFDLYGLGDLWQVI